MGSGKEMRPVNKGESPYVLIHDYSDALPFLEKRIGLYCSYCEFRIDHVPEVEHISAKSKGGDLTAWSNLLLGCKYCNARKGTVGTPINVNDYLWPDTDNTAVAFLYEGGVPSINRSALSTIDSRGDMERRAKNTFDMVKLDNIPKKGDKDRRFSRRNEVYEIAQNSLKKWMAAKGDASETARDLRETTIWLAGQTGFFSIWRTVFADEPEFLNALIEAFPGTNRACFDENGKPKGIVENT
jgi:hypothetical protein